MSEWKESSRGRTLSREVIAEMLMKNFDKLSDFDQKLFRYGPLYVAGNAGMSGLIANSLYRRALNVRQAVFASALPMAGMPFITTFVVYSAAVAQPLLSGDLNCPSCATIRGTLVGVLGGGVYPILLALPINIGLATRYSTAPLPEKGNALKYAMELSRPVLRKMRAAVLLQAIFSLYMSSRHFDIYTKLFHITFSPSREELTD